MANLFNLEEHINKYVADINAKGNLTSEDIKELTTHLHESTEALIALGLNMDEAITVAKLRLGQKDEIAIEYEKVNGSSMLNREWIFIFTGIGAAVIIYNIADAFQLWLAYKTATGHLPVFNAAVVLSCFYVFIILLTVLLFKKGESISSFFRQKIFDKNKFMLGLFAAVVGLLCLFPLNKFLNIGHQYYLPTKQALNNIILNNRVTEFIIRGAVPITITLSIFLSGQSVNKKPAWSTIFKSNNYLYILLAGLGLETVAALTGRMFLLPGLIGPIVFGSVIAAGTAAFFYHNRMQKNVWLKTICFVSVPLCIELASSLLINETGSSWFHSFLFKYFVATVIGIGTSLLLSSILFKSGGTKKQQCSKPT